MVSFIFGGDTGETPESLKRKRELANLLSARNSRAPQNVGEGLSSLGNALLVRSLMGQAGAGEKAGRARAQDIFTQLLGRGASPAAASNAITSAAGQGAFAPQQPTTPPAPQPFTGNPQADANILGINQAAKQDFNAPAARETKRPEPVASPSGASLPRGLRNNNPGNIEFGRFAQGKGAQSSDGRFAQFANPVQGIAAMGDLLKSYQQRGLRTIRQMINRWAPSSENDTNAYVRNVAGAVGIDPDQPFDFSNNPELATRMVAGMIQHENGQQPFPQEIIAAGVGGARVDPAGSTTIAQNRAPANQLAEVGIVGEQQTDAAPNLPAQQQPTNVQPTSQSLQGVPTNSLIALTQHPDFQFLEPQAQKFVQDTIRQRQRLDFEKQKIQLEAQARRNDPLAQARLRQLQRQEELSQAKVEKLQTERLEGQKAEQVRQSAKERTANVVIEDIDRALDIIEGPGLPSTGPVGGVLSNLPGTNAFDVSKLLDTVKANAGFDRLQQMREASKTGGALGQVSERELTFLQATIGNLEQSQSEEQFKRNLQRVREAYDIVINKGLDNVTPGQRSKSRSGRTKSGINFTIEE